MADDAFLREIQEDMEREKLMLFVKKYGIYILSLVVSVLLAVIVYEWYGNRQERHQQNMANHYGKFLSELKDKRNAKPKFAFTEPYSALVASTRYQEIISDKTKDNSENAIKILEDYAATLKSDKPFSYNQEIINLVLLINETKTLKAVDVEKKVQEFVKQNPTFSKIAYELVVAQSIQEGNKELANKYLPFLVKAQTEFYEPSLDKRIKIYKNSLQS